MPNRLTFARLCPASLMALLVAAGCVRSNEQTSTTPPSPPACSPNDMSWGCQAARQPPPQSAAQSTGFPTEQAAAPIGPPIPAPTTYAPAPSPVLAPTSSTSQPAVPSAPPLGSTTAASSPLVDPLGTGDKPYMRQRVQSIVAELIAALEPSIALRLKTIPLVFDPSTAEVNAFATCSRGNKAAIALTDGLLVLSANIAQLRASDDVYGTHLLAEYTQYVAREQRSNQPMLSPQPSGLSPAQLQAPSKLARQLQLFDEMLAFVFGHELAHHYLNHLPCTSTLPLDASELGILMTDAVPAFNQPNESAADIAGIRNVLTAGRKRTSNPLTESGALAQLSFFVALDSARPVDVFTFERTHPPPSLRIPIVQTTAQAVRATGTLTLPW